MNRVDTAKRNKEIVKMKEEGYKQIAIAKKFNITPTQVSRILRIEREKKEE